MSAATRYEDWDDLVSIVQRYARRKYGQRAVAITVHLAHGDAHREPFPDTAAVPERPPPPAREAPVRDPVLWGSGPEPRHRADFSKVYWPGARLRETTFDGLTRLQADAVRVLWQSWEDGEAELPEADVLKRIGSEAARLADVFKRSPAWGTLVIKGAAPKTYRLAPLGEDEPVVEEED